MAAGQLCYSKTSSDYLVFSKNGEHPLVFKKDGGVTQLGDVTIVVTTSPQSWICAEYNCEHEIKCSITSSIGTQSDNTITIPPTPNLSGSITVFLETHCSSDERPTVQIKIIATQIGANGLVESFEAIASSNTYSYTVTLNEDGKISTIE